MARKTFQSTDGTSFFGTTIVASVNQLIRSFGEPSFENNTGEDKINFEWEMETEDGEVFTIYDWKEYTPLREDRMITWHVGGKSERITSKAKKEMLNQL